MSNRTMDQKERKRKQWVYKKAPRKYAAERVKVSQGPDIRIGEYYGRTHGLADDSFVDRRPQVTVQVDDPVLQMEIKKLWQEPKGRLQKIHEYYSIHVPGITQYCCKYYFGGGEHFFVQDLPAMGIRRVSMIFKTKEDAIRSLHLYRLRSSFWVETQVIRTSPASP